MRLAWLAAVVVVIVIGLQLSGGFPKGLTVDVAGRFNQFNDWVIAHRRTSAIFVHGLVPLSNGIQTAFDKLVLILSRMTWLGVVTTAASIAGLVAGWRLAVLAAAGFLLMGALGLWEPSLETLALIILSVGIALAIGIPVGIWSWTAPGRGAGRAARPGRDADHPGVLLPGARRAAVRHRRARPR